MNTRTSPAGTLLLVEAALLALFSIMNGLYTLGYGGLGVMAWFDNQNRLTTSFFGMVVVMRLALLLLSLFSSVIIAVGGLNLIRGHRRLIGIATALSVLTPLIQLLFSLLTLGWCCQAPSWFICMVLGIMSASLGLDAVRWADPTERETW